MMELTASKALRGEVTVPGDKSISHRSVMFGAIAQGTTEVTNFLQGADCLSTISCFQKLGIEIENTPERILVHGKGLHGLSAPSEVLDAGNSGTTTRLISGILSGQTFETTLTGDASVSSSGKASSYAALPTKSAQVKSSILLAGLYADGQTSVTEPALSRNHTELMLSGFGADICSDGLTATITPGNELHAQQIFVPGDISSAAYFLAAGLLVPGSELLIHNVGINPTRAGILTVLRAMGGNLTVLNERVCAGEPVADLLVSASSLHGTTIEGNLIPALIDEIPMIAIMAAFANGQTVIRDAAELKVKESDRIATVTAGLRAMGCDITPTDDGMIIRGGKTLHGAEIDSYLDHRIAMSFAVAALAADGVTSIKDADCVKISYPNFYDDLLGLAK